MEDEVFTCCGVDDGGSELAEDKVLDYDLAEDRSKVEGANIGITPLSRDHHQIIDSIMCLVGNECEENEENSAEKIAIVTIDL